MKLGHKRGSTIIEVLVASVLIATAVLAAMSLSSNSQKQTDYSRDLNQATVYNNQALEWFRNMRTLIGWKGMTTYMDAVTSTNQLTYCLNTLPTNETGFQALTNAACSGTIGTTSFKREASITLSGSPIDKATIVITTTWLSGKYHATTETVLTDWK